MSIRVTWLGSDPTVVSYDLEKATVVNGPWSFVTNISAVHSYLNYLTDRYFYVDVTGLPANYYRLTAITAEGLRSLPSSPFQQALAPQVPTSTATATFIGPDGRPQKRSVIIAIDDTQVISGFVVGSPEQMIVIPSDDMGFWQAALVQGARIKVAIEGTGVVRAITVPITPSFDLMQAMAEAPDTFDVQTIPPLLTRRSI